MEVLGGTNNKLAVCFVEMLGTMFLLIGVNWGGTSGNEPASVGFTIMACAQMFGPISGGHFNPAVTMGMFIKELGKPTNKVAWTHNLGFAGLIILSQLVGATLGVALCSLGFFFRQRPNTILP